MTTGAKQPLPLPAGDPCHFCEIIGGRGSRWNVVEETPVTVLNGRQFEIGQCIIVTRRHAPTLLDLDAPEATAVMAAAQRLMRVMIEAYAPDGVLLYQNNGTGSGQEVPHFHVHVVPRREGSDWGMGPAHIARLEGGKRPLHLDHRQVTDAKLATAAELRARL